MRAVCLSMSIADFIILNFKTRLMIFQNIIYRLTNCLIKAKLDVFKIVENIHYKTLNKIQVKLGLTVAIHGLLHVVRSCKTCYILFSLD